VNISDILTSTSYSNVVATTAMIVAIVAVPAGGYLSYHFAIKGEKRKEWNSIVEPILDYLEGHQNLLTKKKCPDHTLHSFPSKNWDAAVRRVHSGNPEQKLKEYVNILNEIRKSPAPLQFFGQTESDREDWVDNYPLGIKALNELICILSLK
jgi:hypothetical protein